MLKCVECNSDILNKGQKYCSKVCRSHGVNRPYKNKILATRNARALETKMKLIQLKGGACVNCGYNKTFSALSFHHLDPKNKKFSLTTDALGHKRWSKVLEEVNKCKLLCLNCHAEEHHPLRINEYKDKLNELKNIVSNKNTKWTNLEFVNKKLNINLDANTIIDYAQKLCTNKRYKYIKEYLLNNKTYSQIAKESNVAIGNISYSCKIAFKQILRGLNDKS